MVQGFHFNSVLRPFQDYFSSYETGQSVEGRKRENPEKNHLKHPQAELGQCGAVQGFVINKHVLAADIINSEISSLKPEYHTGFR